MNESEFVNLTALGKIYGVSATQAGRWLKGLLLRRDDGWPSWDAIEQGFVLERKTEWGSSWSWNREKVCEQFDGMCYPRAGTVPLFPHIEEHEFFTIIRGGRR